MALFAPNKPKGITKDELQFVRGELRMGSGSEKLTDRQIEAVMDRLQMAMDSDTAQDLKYHWEQVSEGEVLMIENQIAGDKNLPFSKEQRAHVERVLNKYLSINRTKSVF